MLLVRTLWHVDDSLELMYELLSGFAAARDSEPGEEGRGGGEGLD